MQNTEVSENIQERFQDLCTRYFQVFLNDSEDFGHTDLVTMDMEVGTVCLSHRSLIIYI